MGQPRSNISFQGGQTYMRGATPGLGANLPQATSAAALAGPVGVGRMPMGPAHDPLAGYTPRSTAQTLAPAGANFTPGGHVNLAGSGAVGTDPALPVLKNAGGMSGGTGMGLAGTAPGGGHTAADFNDYNINRLTGPGVPHTGQGYEIGPNGVQAWGYNQYEFNGHSTPNNFNLGGNLAGGDGGGSGGNGGGAPGHSGAGNRHAGGIGGSAYGGALTNPRMVGNGMQNDLNAANAANEARYQQALGTNATGQTAQQNALNTNYQNIYNAIAGGQAAEMDIASGLGGTQHEQETRRLNNAVGSNQQSLIGRGLGNSTILDDQRKGLESESAFNQRAIDEENAKLRLGILSHGSDQQIGALGNYAGANQGILSSNQAQRIGILESKSDLGPNVAAYLQALSAQGAQGQRGGAATGGGGSGAGSGNSGADLIAQYLASLQGGGGNTSSTGGFTPDPRTVAANNRIREQQGGAGGGNASSTWNVGAQLDGGRSVTGTTTPYDAGHATGGDAGGSAYGDDPTYFNRIPGSGAAQQLVQQVLGQFPGLQDQQLIDAVLNRASRMGVNVDPQELENAVYGAYD